MGALIHSLLYPVTARLSSHQAALLAAPDTPGNTSSPNLNRCTSELSWTQVTRELGASSVLTGCVTLGLLTHHRPQYPHPDNKT